MRLDTCPVTGKFYQDFRQRSERILTAHVAPSLKIGLECSATTARSSGKFLVLIVCELQLTLHSHTEKRCKAPPAEDTNGGGWDDSGADAGGVSGDWANADAGATNGESSGNWADASATGNDSWGGASAGGGW